MAADHYDGQDLEALAEMPRYTDWIVDFFRPYLRGRIIEVGAGIGNVTARYADAADELLLVEPADNLFPRLLDRFAGDSRVQGSNAVLERVEPALLERPFDAAIMVNVLEHIDDDAATITRLGEVLTDDGHLLIFVPALPWLFGSLDELVHHFRRYTRKSLAGLLESRGFDVIDMRYFDVLGMAPWFVAGRVFRRDKFDEGGAKLYDRFGVPLTAFVERLIVPPLGKSLICVAQKRAANA